MLVIRARNACQDQARLMQEASESYAKEETYVGVVRDSELIANFQHDGGEMEFSVLVGKG